ncbi:MAG TPA: hypothetical protein VGK74_22345 [Symbiobacteriaceae bacterium]
MSVTSFEILNHYPVCRYCGYFPAAWTVIVLVNDEEKRYVACQYCKEAVEAGLQECDYTCEADHLSLRKMPVDPGEFTWMIERLREDGKRWGAWIRARCPALREENGVIVWDTPASERLEAAGSNPTQG